jgi:hypothetical protein
MNNLDSKTITTMEELLVASLATAEALARLLIEKRVIESAEFMQRLAAEKSAYQLLLKQKIGSG